MAAVRVVMEVGGVGVGVPGGKVAERVLAGNG